MYTDTKSSFKVILGVTVPAGTSKTNSYSSNGLNPSTRYYYQIVAVDDAGNIGPLSNTRYGLTNAAISNGDDNPTTENTKVVTPTQNESPPQGSDGLSVNSFQTTASTDRTPPVR